MAYKRLVLARLRASHQCLPCSSGPNCNNSYIYPEYRKPLGAPLEDAQAAPGGVLTRRFAHGAVAKFRAGASSTARGQACVVWADRSISGKCPTDSDPPCETMLRTVCGAAKRAGKGNCFICTGQHQQAMMQVHCTQSDFDLFCT